MSAAISQAAPGDTIVVSAGTYAENLVINKRLALLGGGDGSGDPAARSSVMRRMTSSSRMGCW